MLDILRLLVLWIRDAKSFQTYLESFAFPHLSLSQYCFSFVQFPAQLSFFAFSFLVLHQLPGLVFVIFGSFISLILSCLYFENFNLHFWHHLILYLFSCYFRVQCNISLFFKCTCLSVIGVLFCSLKNLAIS